MELGFHTRPSGSSLSRVLWRLTTWLGAGTAAALEGIATGRQKRRRELERELQREENALAEAAALLMLRKRAEAIWGDCEDD
jgi:hypothetical protein